MHAVPLTGTSELQPSVPRRVLVVDDRRDSVLLLRRMLELAGHEVYSAQTAREGIDAARQFVPEIILCDISLPGGMSGYDLAAAIRSDPVCRGIYLVAVSGYGDEEHRKKARASGFDHHVTKPVIKEQLDELVSTMPRFPVDAGKPPDWPGLTGKRL